MLHLFIDTATEKAFLGLAEDDHLLEEVHLPLGFHNSKLLFPSLMDLFRRHQIKPKDLGLISCGVGPGSYTGIRVGASAAQAMAYALSIPLVGVCSLEAYRPADEGGAFAVLLDARVAGVYVLQSNSPPEAIEINAAEDRLKGISRLISPHPELIKQRLSLKGDWEEAVPSGQMFLTKAFRTYLSGDVVKDGSLHLLYLRKTEAEMKHC